MQKAELVQVYVKSKGSSVLVAGRRSGGSYDLSTGGVYSKP